MPRAARLGRRSWVGRHRQAERLGHLLRGRTGSSPRDRLGEDQVRLGEDRLGEDHLGEDQVV